MIDESHFLYNSKKIQSLINEFGIIEANKIVSSSKIYKKKYLKDDQITSIDDFFKYLKNIKYWKLDKKYIPIHVYEFVYMNRLRIYIKGNILKKYKELQYIWSIAVNDSHYYEKYVMDYCAYMGYLNCIKICLSKGYPYDRNTYALAAYYGNIECLRHLYKDIPFIIKKIKFDESIMRAAMGGGYNNCINYVINNM